MDNKYFVTKNTKISMEFEKGESEVGDILGRKGVKGFPNLTSAYAFILQNRLLSKVDLLKKVNIEDLRVEEE